jgi:hypothetical protein
MFGLFFIGSSGYSSRWPPLRGILPDRRLHRVFLYWGLGLIGAGFAGFSLLYWPTADVLGLLWVLVVAASLAYVLGWLVISIQHLLR